MECRGRNRLDPSSRRKISGLDASSGGVSRTDPRSAASVIWVSTASRSCTVSNRQPMVWRAASAIRFQRRHVDRRSPTTATTRPARSAATSPVTSSARSTAGACRSMTVDAHAVASSPSRLVARRHQPDVNSDSGFTCFSGRVERVACARSFTIAALPGRWPCLAR